MKLRAYLNQFNRTEHAAEVQRLCREVPISRVTLYGVMNGKILRLEKALGFARATGFKVDPRTFNTPVNWEVLDEYYEKHGGAASPFRTYPEEQSGGASGKASAKPAGSGGGKRNPAAVRRTPGR